MATESTDQTQCSLKFQLCVYVLSGEWGGEGLGHLGFLSTPLVGWKLALDR